jgi:catechol 2,3-dioxygenase-like lactoylglutathione lyase family enzyme
MFANTKAFSGFAVDDLRKAQEFYGKTLGLKTSEEHGLLTLHLAGDRPTLIYPQAGPHTRRLHDPQLPGAGHRQSRR